MKKKIEFKAFESNELQEMFKIVGGAVRRTRYNSGGTLYCDTWDTLTNDTGHVSGDYVKTNDLFQ